ncbi:Large neutral amino acids transporter small subunit 1 [Lamellibrachia satsuma]|nr:Large neutral amino acids transporter small subunit 1 [Lamellibrachia satsuma]
MAERRHVRKSHSVTDDDDDFANESVPLLQTSTDDTVQGPTDNSSDGVRQKRHITLFDAVAIMVGNVIGSGIFLSPSGVTRNIGSVGGSLLVWAIMGLYNLIQALCYAELGTMIPLAGGDYTYIYEIVGAMPAFMCLWIHIVVISASSCAVISRTAALYLIEPLNEGCHVQVITILAAWIIVSLAFVNAFSTIWAIRVQVVFTFCKVCALLVVIIVGAVQLGKGHVENFKDPFANTSTNPGAIALSSLDGYFAYKGWELINALSEEMVNPSRDLPLTVWISMTLVTIIYVLTNTAYFTALTPQEVCQSDAVALTFADRTMGAAMWIIPISVALSAMGAVNGDFLSNSRYLFAGGRYHQMPQVMSFIHTKRYTPVVAIILLCLLALVYCAFTQLEKVQEYASLAVQLKMLLALTALFYMRWKAPSLHRPVRVNTFLAVLALLVMLALIGLSFLKDPVTTGIGVVVFLAGIPLYLLTRVCYRSSGATRAMDKVTRVLQKILLLVPEDAPKNIPEEAPKNIPEEANTTP